MMVRDTVGAVWLWTALSLASELKKDPATVSKWCTNTSQPDLHTLTKIAFLLGIEVRELINKNQDIYEDCEAVQ